MINIRLQTGVINSIKSDSTIAFTIFLNIFFHADPIRSPIQFLIQSCSFLVMCGRRSRGLGMGMKNKRVPLKFPGKILSYDDLVCWRWSCPMCPDWCIFIRFRAGIQRVGFRTQLKKSYPLSCALPSMTQILYPTANVAMLMNWGNIPITVVL